MRAKTAILPDADTGCGHATIFHAEMWTDRMGEFLDQIAGWKQKAP